MKILLIGKFPPCQGGVSSKYFWMYTALSRHYNFSWHAVTVRKKPYYSLLPEGVRENVSVLDDTDCNMPWFIPKTDLIVDRIVSAAIEIAEKQKFDLVEVNYLQPFYSAGWILSKILNLPLIIHPAGSDYHKFLQHPGLKYALEAYLSRSSYILLPPEKIDDFHRKIPRIAMTNIIPAKRYVPDPDYFSSLNVKNTFDKLSTNGKTILFIGKTNQFWSLRKIEKLFPFLNANNEYKLKCLIDGSHWEEFINFVNANVNNKQLEIVHGFIPPDIIPCELQEVIAVWNYLAPGGIVDFPNTHWETVASGKYSLVSDFLLKQPDIQCSDIFLPLTINADDPLVFDKIKKPLRDEEIQDVYNEAVSSHKEYLDAAMSLYMRAKNEIICR